MGRTQDWKLVKYQYTEDPRVTTLKVIYLPVTGRFKTFLILHKQFINGVHSAGDPSPNFVNF